MYLYKKCCARKDFAPTQQILRNPAMRYIPDPALFDDRIEIYVAAKFSRYEFLMTR